MLSIKCPIPDCPYETPESSEAVTCALLAAHSMIHMAGPPRAAVVIKGPKLDRPKVNIGVTLEEWNIFKRRWDVFVSGSGLDPDASSSQLFQCAGDELGDSLLKTNPSIVSKPTSVVMGAMQSLAVIVVATGVMRAELVRMQQERDESFRAFEARVRSKAETCAYITKCTCLREVDFTDSIIRDVLIAGIADLDIHREVLGTSAILERAVNDVISSSKARKWLGMLCPHPRLAYPPSSGADRYQQRNRLPLIGPRLRYAQIANKHLHSSRRQLAVGTPDHTVNASSATEDAVSDEAAHRLVSMLTYPQPQRWVPCSRKCHR